MGRDNLIARLKEEAEQQYRIFNGRFVLTNKNEMLGVKVPKMRSMAKEIALGNWKSFLRGYGFSVAQEEEKMLIPDSKMVYFEEVMIVGMVINLINVEPGLRLHLVEQFVPYIDNWSVCDVFCGGAKWVGEPGKGPKSRNKVPLQQMWEFLQGYLYGHSHGAEHENEEFATRYGVVMLLCCFLNGAYIDKVLDSLAKINFGNYYVDMGVAWCLATARAKFDRKTKEFVERTPFPKSVIDKYNRKVKDSLRIKEK